MDPQPARPAARKAPLAGLRRHPFLVGAVLLAVAVGAALSARGLFAKAPEKFFVAVVMPLSGPREAEGRAVVHAVELKFDAVNRAGGIGGRKLTVLAYDDANDPATAAAVAKEVVAGPALAVIGHLSSSTSIAAGAVYKEAGLPAVTGSATADELTVDNPFYFRVGFDGASQGWAMAIYASRVLKSAKATILSSDEESGRSQLASFKKTFPIVGGEIVDRWVYDAKASPEARRAAVERIAAAVREETAGTVVLAVSPQAVAREALVALRRLGVDPVILGGSAMGSAAFAESMASEPEEKKEKGYFTKRLYATTPVVFDTANDRMSAFAAEYRAAYREEPDGRSVRYFEAASAVAEAIRLAHSAGASPDRGEVRDRIAAFDSPEGALPGLTGPIWFDESQTLPEPARIARFVRGELFSAPLQIAAVQNPALVDLEKELRAGNVFPFGSRYFWTQQVVSTGVDFREISGIDPVKGTFTADFYLWFRYAGDDEVTDIDLNFAGDKSPFDPKAPLASKEIDGMKYRLYNVRGDFKTDLDFHDYPFDSQSLRLLLSNPRLPRESVIYAIDSLGLKLPRKPRDVGEMVPPPSWQFAEVRYSPDTRRTSSTRGDPGSFEAKYETEFSGYKAVVRVERQSRAFLFKQLLPLMLLIVAVYLGLHFINSMTNERIGVTITALLASAVIQSGLTSQLSVGYSTAIDYGFYGFLVLCIFCIFMALMAALAHHSGRPDLVRRLDLAARWIYLTSVFATFAAYYFIYGTGTGP